jgi:uncharacterized protein (TIGR02145 family)
MKKILPICFILIILFGGCTLFEDESDQSGKIEDGESLKLENQKLIFSIFEIVSVDLGDGDFTDGEIEGTTLEGEKIPLTIQDNTLTFLVPRLNPGAYKLVFLEKDKPFNISFEVKPHALKHTPVQYLEFLSTDYQDKIQSLEKTKSLLSDEKKALLEKDLDLLKKRNEEFNAKAALLKESELADLAYFLEANGGWIEEMSTAFVELNSVVPNGRIMNDQRVNIEEMGNELMHKFPAAVMTVVKHIPKIVKAVSIGFLAGSVIPGIGNSAGVIIGLGWSIGNMLLDIKELFAQVDANAEFVRVTADQIMESRYRMAEYSFENGVEYELFVSRNYRTLYEGDKTSAIPAVKNYLGSFDLLLTEWAKVKSKIPLDLGYQPTNPATVPTFDSKSFLVHSDHLSITDISSPKVSGEASKENGKLLLTFYTVEATTQEFSFSLVYENQNFGKLEKTLEAAVIKGSEYGTFTDTRDGNVYKTVKIGSQTWFAENLRYAGNIPQVASQQAWVAIYNFGNPTGQPAWAYYNNNPGYDAVYGKLYNWYAVNTGTLCPPGWHIPTDAEWTTLTNYLGGSGAAGGKLKSVTGWIAPNIGATNESGFTGLPGGNRWLDGVFHDMGEDGYWWSSSPNGSTSAWNHYLLTGNGSFFRNSNSRAYGFSCRCLKD